MTHSSSSDSSSDSQHEVTEAELLAYQEFVDATILLAQDSPTIALVCDAIRNNTGKVALKLSLSELTEEWRNILADQMKNAHESGIIDLLYFLQSRGYQIIAPNGVKLPRKPYGNEVVFDYLTRQEGDEWDVDDYNA